MSRTLYQGIAEPLFTTPAVPAPDLSWQPEHPDLQPPPPPSLSAAILAGALFFVAVGVSDAAPIQSWQGSYPDRLNQPPITAHLSPTTPVQPIPAPGIGAFQWSAVFPDFIPRPSRLLDGQQQEYVGPVSPIAPPAPDIRFVTYPDAVARVVLPVSAMPDWVEPFSPAHPVIVAGAADSGVITERQVQYQALAFPVPFEVVAIPEQPSSTSPDPIRLQGPIWRAGATWVPEHAPSEGAALGWTARFPDTLWRWPSTLAVWRPVVSGPISPIPAPEVSWQPILVIAPGDPDGVVEMGMHPATVVS